MAKKKMTESSVLRALKWAFEQALEGPLGFQTVDEMADEYLRRKGTPIQQARSLVRWQVAKTGAAGFFTGLGGILTLPVAIPANVASVMFVQLRMIAAVAKIGGNQPRSDRVQILAFACLCGTSVTDVLKGAGIKVGAKLTEQAIRNISADALKAINRAVGFRLLTKFGQKGVLNFGKLVPVLGGLVGGTADAMVTRIVGQLAIKMFVANELSMPADRTV